MFYKRAKVVKFRFQNPNYENETRKKGQVVSVVIDQEKDFGAQTLIRRFLMVFKRKPLPAALLELLTAAARAWFVAANFWWRVEGRWRRPLSRRW